MLERLKSYTRHLIKNTAQQRDLAKLPVARTDAAALRQITAKDLETMMRDTDHGAAWEAAEARINAVITVGQLGVGGVNPGDRRALYHLIKGMNARSVLEVGTNIGTSTRSMAMALRENGADAGQMTTVDIVDVNDGPGTVWQSSGLPMSPRASLEALDLGDLVEFVVGDSIKHLAQTENRYDVIFLDGDHNATAVYQEVPLALDRLNPGGVIILHDYIPNALASRNGNIPIGPCLAADRLSAENPSLTVVPLGDLPWETKNGSHRTTLAVVARI